ncbi:hypothetical protein F511_39026 [Dorcoceras hygrometricum]|uniref:Uncharacterized protein n=1 Tax=Dorcoceras hygrometricum TaxID=472368 RepID=A0A2Z7BX03_9LAMI|nr:hypothetical protein F511_39026 [Dorcoceras hygrometricum]
MTQLWNEISIINQYPNHSDSAGYRDTATTLDSQHDDSAGKSRLSDYQVSKKQAQYAMRVGIRFLRPSIVVIVAQKYKTSLHIRSQLLLSSTSDQTSHFRMRPVLFTPKWSNEQDTRALLVT